MKWTICARGLAARLLLAGTLTTLLLAGGSSSWASTSLNSSRSNVNRVGGPTGLGNVSASTNLTGPTDTQTVYTATQGFFLTQACVSNTGSSAGVRLDNNGTGGIGSIAVVGATADNLCQSFLPAGVFIVSGSTITCSISGASAGTHFCRISGVLAK